MSLTLENVSRVVNGETHIDNVDITFESGSFNVLLGRTLAGKTSLMRLMAGLDKPDQGRVLMNGVDVTGTPVQQRNISMVYQQFINYPNLSVFENIASPLRIAGTSDAEIKDRVEKIASMLHIEDYLQRYPLELSGGQQQRTAMARALIKESGLILFDEPLVNLDYKLREELRFELRELFKSQNTIAIYASTEPNEALALGGTTTLMHEGRVIQSGPASDVYAKPESIEAAELLSEPPINILQGSVNNGEVSFGSDKTFSFNQQLRKIESGQFKFGMRPHHISLEQVSADDICLEMRVDVAEVSGFETFLHMTDGKMNLVAQLAGVHQFSADQLIKAYLPMHRLFVFDLDGNMIQAPYHLVSNVDEKKEVYGNG